MTQSYPASRARELRDFTATPAEIDRNVGRRGHSFASTLSLPHSRQRVLWRVECPQGGTGARRWMVHVHRNGDCAGDLGHPTGQMCLLHLPTSPSLHSSLAIYEREK